MTLGWPKETKEREKGRWIHVSRQDAKFAKGRVIAIAVLFFFVLWTCLARGDSGSARGRRPRPDWANLCELWIDMRFWSLHVPREVALG